MTASKFRTKPLSSRNVLNGTLNSNIDCIAEETAFILENSPEEVNKAICIIKGTLLLQMPARQKACDCMS